MGIVYTLVKQDQPVAFNLGKGNWDLVFDRSIGIYIPLVGHVGSNFEKPFKISNTKDLKQSIEKFMPWWNNIAQVDELVDKIQIWAGTSNLYLINYWEEIEYYQSRRWKKKADEAFTDLREKLIKPLYYYKITGSVYD